MDDVDQLGAWSSWAPWQQEVAVAGLGVAEVCIGRHGNLDSGMAVARPHNMLSASDGVHFFARPGLTGVSCLADQTRPVGHRPTITCPALK